MTSAYTLRWRGVTRQAARVLAKTDPDGIARVTRALDALKRDPRPTGCLRMGPDLVRVHVGFYRVVVHIDESAAVVTVMHLGRNPTG